MKKQRKVGSPYTIDGYLPLRQAIPLGMQHVLAMFIGNITAPLVVCAACGIQGGSSLMIVILQNAMLVAGLTTLLQLYPIWKAGARLPIVMGCSAGYIGVYLSISNLVGGGLESYSIILGATLLGGCVEIIIACFYHKVKKLFPPLVIGTVLTAVGISLVPIAINSFAGGSGAADYGSAPNLIIAFVVFAVGLAFSRFGKGMARSCGMLIGILVGYIMAAIMTACLPTTVMYTDAATGAVSEVAASWAMDWSSVAEASWFSLPKLMPVPLKFDLRAILPICLIYVSMTIESMASINAITEVGLGRRVKNKEMVGGLICDAIGSSGAAVFGVLPNTTFNQNVGLVNMTKIVNRFSVATGAIFLCLCGFLPKLVALVSIMPDAVLGGATVLMFGQILCGGIALIAKSGFTGRANTIVAASIGLGFGLGSDAAAMVGFPDFIQLVVGGSGIIPCAVLAILLNVILPKEKEDKEIDAAIAAAEEAEMRAAAEAVAAVTQEHQTE